VLAPHTTDPSVARTLQVARITPRGGAAALWSRMAHSRWVRRGVLALGFGAVAVALGYAVVSELPRQTPNAAADTTVTPRDTTPLVMPPIQAAVPDSPGVEPQSEPTLGTVRVSVPDDARVELDGVEQGRGALRLTNVEPGSRTIRASLTGAEGCDAASVSRTISVTAGRTEMVTLEPRRCGSLVLNVDPERASFTLLAGNRVVRTGFVSQAPVILLPAGTYQLQLRAEGCQDYAAPVQIVEGQQETRHARLLDCPAPPAPEPR
jgi:hypothetical protein